MAPMLSSQYFQPMQHKPLPDLRKYTLLGNQGSEFMTVVKPNGMDVYIQNGKIFDFNNNELQNQYLKFHFEKLLQTTVNLQMVVVGVLVCTNTPKMLAHRYGLYSSSRSVNDGLKLLVYDITFPVFNVDHDYKWRYNIAEKTIAILPNCEILTFRIVKDELDLRTISRDTLEQDITSTILSYKVDGKYIYGNSQLLWDDTEAFSYSIQAKQRFRGHIKRVVSVTEQHPNGDKVELASYIVARFKKEYINVPINLNNLALRSYIWKHRNDLKAFPFWFTGYTYIDPVVGSVDYVTIVNEFLSFIPTIDACPTK